MAHCSLNIWFDILASLSVTMLGWERDSFFLLLTWLINRWRGDCHRCCLFPVFFSLCLFLKVTRVTIFAVIPALSAEYKRIWNLGVWESWTSSLFSDTSMKLYFTPAAFVIHTFGVQTCSGATIPVAELIFLLSIIKSSCCCCCCCSVSISGKLPDHSEVTTISLISQEFTSSSSSASSTVLSTCRHVSETLLFPASVHA